MNSWFSDAWDSVTAEPEETEEERLAREAAEAPPPPGAPAGGLFGNAFSTPPTPPPAGVGQANQQWAAMDRVNARTDERGTQ